LFEPTEEPSEAVWSGIASKLSQQEPDEDGPLPQSAE